MLNGNPLSLTSTTSPACHQVYKKAMYEEVMFNVTRVSSMDI